MSKLVCNTEDRFSRVTAYRMGKKLHCGGIAMVKLEPYIEQVFPGKFLKALNVESII